MEINSYFFWQLFWILAAITTVTAFMYSDKNKTVKILLVWALLSALQFVFLWALSWAFISIFSFFRTVLSRFKSKNISVLLMLFIIIGIISYYTYDWYISLLPIVATYIGTYALFYVQWVQFRVALVIPTTLWLIYNYYVWSIWWTIREVIILILHIKVIVLSLGFVYRKEIYKLNYDIFVYLYNSSISNFTLLWKRFLHSLQSVYKIFSRKKKWSWLKRLSD